MPFIIVLGIVVPMRHCPLSGTYHGDTLMEQTLSITVKESESILIYIKLISVYYKSMCSYRVMVFTTA